MKTLQEILEEAEQDTRGLNQVTVAEEEIEVAIGRHPASADRLFHAFWLLTPYPDRAFWNEAVLRSHCRELLDRVAKAEDTRAPTDVEMLLVITAAHMRFPPNGGALALYCRLWLRSGMRFPGDEDVHAYFTGAREHWEWTDGQHADDLERLLREEMRVPSRMLKDSEIECDGDHWGETANCRFATSGREAPSAA